MFDISVCIASEKGRVVIVCLASSVCGAWFRNLVDSPIYIYVVVTIPINANLYSIFR